MDKTGSSDNPRTGNLEDLVESGCSAERAKVTVKVVDVHNVFPTLGKDLPHNHPEMEDGFTNAFAIPSRLGPGAAENLDYATGLLSRRSNSSSHSTGYMEDETGGLAPVCIYGAEDGKAF